MAEHQTKRAYGRPELIAFGSVRNLTGGSNGSEVDVNTTKKKKSV